MSRERCMGSGVSLGEETVLAVSGWEGEVAALGRAGEKSDCFSILLVPCSPTNPCVRILSVPRLTS